MRNTSFCYHHRRRQLRPAEVHIPELTDPHNVQVALTGVLHGLLTGRLQSKEAGQLIYAIQMAVAEERRKPWFPKV